MRAARARQVHHPERITLGGFSFLGILQAKGDVEASQLPELDRELTNSESRCSI
jgi:hypothetical protein